MSRMNWRPRCTTTNSSPRRRCSSGLCRCASDGPGHHPTTPATTPPSTHMPGIMVSLDTSRISFLATTSISHTRTHIPNQISLSNNSPSTPRSTTTTSLASAPRATIHGMAYRWTGVIAVVTVAVPTVLGRGCVMGSVTMYRFR